MFRFLERAQDRALSVLHPIRWWAALDRAVDKRGFFRFVVMALAIYGAFSVGGWLLARVL